MNVPEGTMSRWNHEDPLKNLPPPAPSAPRPAGCSVCWGRSKRVCCCATWFTCGECPGAAWDRQELNEL